MSEPLNNEFEINLNDVDLNPPVFAAGAYAFEIVDVKIADNKAGTGKNFVVTFASLAPATSKNKVNAGDHDANDIPAGRKLTKHYPLQGSQKNADWDFRVEPTRLFMAAFNCSKAECPPLKADSGLVGKKLVLQLKVAPETDTFGESNEVVKYMPLT